MHFDKGFTLLITRGAVDMKYSGSKLKRLLQQRWSGHLQTVTVVVNNYSALVEARKDCSESNSVAGDLKALASGYLA